MVILDGMEGGYLAHPLGYRVYTKIGLEKFYNQRIITNFFTVTTVV